MTMTTEFGFDERINHAPPDYKQPRDFAELFLPLHTEFTARRRALAATRREVMENSRCGILPDYLPKSIAQEENRKIASLILTDTIRLSSIDDSRLYRDFSSPLDF